MGEREPGLTAKRLRRFCPDLNKLPPAIHSSVNRGAEWRMYYRNEVRLLWFRVVIVNGVFILFKFMLIE